MPMYTSSRLAALAPVAMAAMRPCAELKPWAPLTKYVGVLEEQPIPLSLAIMWGGVDSSQKARTIAAVTESCPQPAQSVDMAPSYSRIVSPSSLRWKAGWTATGLVIAGIVISP